MVRIRRQQRWILGVLVGLSGLFGVIGWQGHNLHAVSVSPTPHVLAGDSLPIGPKTQ